MSNNKFDTHNFCIENCDFYPLLTNEERTLLQSSLTKINYKKKENLLKQNSHCSYLMYLTSGLVKVFTERRNDKNIILNIAIPGTLIGLSSLTYKNYNYSAVALHESDVSLISKEVIFEIAQTNAAFAKYLFLKQSEFTSGLIDKLSSLGTKQMHGRLADVIIYLCSPLFQNTNVYDYITRKDIAEMSGMSSESAIRLLTEFKNDNLIKMDGKKIEIYNMELLARLSEIG